MKKIHTSAPGTLMLMGEHAVLHGKHALVAATDQRLHVYLTPRQDQSIRIESTLGKYESSLKAIEVKAPFDFVLSVIQQFKKQLPSGFDLKIESEFSATVGLGSSAAVLAAMTKAILTFLDFQLQADTILFDLAYKSLIKVQGRGSGADLAASILGGIVLYRHKPFFWEKLDFLMPITLVYCGYKTPTPEVIQIVETARLKDPGKFERIFARMDQAVLSASDDFVNSFKTCQTLMEELGVVDETLQNIVNLFNPTPAKVSGSGLGDCVIGLGTCAKIGNYPIIPAQLSSQGVLLHDA